MHEDALEISLRGQFLLAMPGIGDPRFDASVIYLLAHDHLGAMGFMVNKPADGMALGDVVQNLAATLATQQVLSLPVFVGGPIQESSGYVLHTADYTKSASELTCNLPVHLTQSVEVLSDMVSGQGPRYLRLFLGYSGWGPGQLEEELQDNAWLVSPADTELMFTHDPETLYHTILARLGIDLSALSLDSGDA